MHRRDRREHPVLPRTGSSAASAASDRRGLGPCRVVGRRPRTLPARGLRPAGISQRAGWAFVRLHTWPLCMAGGLGGVLAGAVTERSLCAGWFGAGKAPGAGRCAASGGGAGSGCYCQRSGSLARICADCPVVMVSIQVAVRLSGGTSSTRSGAWPVPPRPRVRVVCQLPSLSRIQVTGQAGSSSGQQLAGHFGRWRADGSR